MNLGSQKSRHRMKPDFPVDPITKVMLLHIMYWSLAKSKSNASAVKFHD